MNPQSLLAERRACIAELRGERDKTARQMLQFRIDEIDRELHADGELDAKILKVIESGAGVLQMTDWHTCETTHCRAGWAVHLAGKAGYDLERKLGSTAVAGALIYHRSTGNVPDFYASDELALADIVACAHDQEART